MSQLNNGTYIIHLMVKDLKISIQKYLKDIKNKFIIKSPTIL